MTVQRVLRGVAASVWVQLTDQDGSDAAAAGAVTVTVTRADGTVVVTGAATTAAAGYTGRYTYTLSAAVLATLDYLTLVWTDAGDGSTHTTYVEVVGGYMFTVAEARGSDPSLRDQAKYPTPDIVAARREVEDECEHLTGVAWVPRFARERLSGSGGAALILPHQQIRTVRTVRDYSDATTYTSYTSDDLADLDLADSGVVTRRLRGYWAFGATNLVVEYEHGYDAPPADLKRAALIRLRTRLNEKNRAIPDRAIREVVGDDGRTFRLSIPAAERVGIPEVDAIYERYSRRTPVVA